mmetsp:Transcript_44644/g.103103  ORF Transcript_44644/g.103103 Transcript_44644/m.103103 type:complete len:680 (-) Transcript_44644:29-2068(-)
MSLDAQQLEEEVQAIEHELEDGKDDGDAPADPYAVLGDYVDEEEEEQEGLSDPTVELYPIGYSSHAEDVSAAVGANPEEATGEPIDAPLAAMQDISPEVTIDVGDGPFMGSMDMFVGADDIADDDTEPPEEEELAGELLQVDEEFDMAGEEVDEAIPLDLMEEEGEAPGPKEEDAEFEDLDDNELAAQALEAELADEPELSAKLNAILARRRGASAAAPLVDDRVEVPGESAGYVIGAGGQNIRRLSKDSGARLTLLREQDKEERKCTLVLRGTAEAVSKAKELVSKDIEQAVAGAANGNKGKGKGKRKGANHAPGEDPEGGASGMAGESAGICKWFAAGFCRNYPEGGRCRNGVHDSTAAQRAEAAWVADGPSTGTARSAGLPVLLILDFEGGGNADGRDGEDELIEVPVLAMCPATGRELGRFHRFSRPSVWDTNSDSMRRRYAVECFNDASTAVRFPEVLRALREWICEVVGLTNDFQLTTEHFLFITCGNWDVKTAMPRQCVKEGGLHDLRHLLCARWCNLKDVFRIHFQLADGEAPTGMRGMLKRLRIPLSGQHHLGMDDVSNLAKIVKKMVSLDAKLIPTGFARPEGANEGFKGGFGKGFGKAPKGKEKGKFGDKGGKFGDKSKGGKGKWKDCKGKDFKGNGGKDLKGKLLDGMLSIPSGHSGEEPSAKRVCR